MGYPCITASVRKKSSFQAPEERPYLAQMWGAHFWSFQQLAVEICFAHCNGLGGFTLNCESPEEVVLGGCNFQEHTAFELQQL